MGTFDNRKTNRFGNTYDSRIGAPDYFPPILGNGEISVAPDCEGAFHKTAAEYRADGVSAFDSVMVRSGRRTAYSAADRIFPFGSLSFDEGSALDTFTQTLAAEEGCVRSVCSYRDGAKITTECFIHPTETLYAVRKSFAEAAGSSALQLCFTFRLTGYDETVSQRMNVTSVNVSTKDVRIGFRFYGGDVYTGEIRLWMDCPFTAEALPDGARLTFRLSDDAHAALYYALEDDLEQDDVKGVLDRIEKKADTLGYDGLFEECRADFAAYFEKGYVKTGDETLDRIYRACLYDLKCYTTKYSIPVGLNNAYWHGRFFAFDEYYSYFALLTANRPELAKRVPTFRLEHCLEQAIARASDNHRTEETVEMARFYWETGEKCDMELSPAGTWLDHVFHIPIVGIGAFQYYLFTGDRAFLARCYRMIRACAKFFTVGMIYRDGSRTYIGKCTDLERLGAAVENPFMTACGVIELLECCAKAADILDTDQAYRDECRATAAELRKNLPEDGEKYEPFAGCTQKSIAVFAGKYPFDVLDSEDPKLRRAWQDYEEHGARYGNMYPIGTHISPWYAAWKAESYARAGMAEKAREALREVYPSAGVFGELFEINEPGIRIKPWFTTAHGIFLSAVNEMLVQSDEEHRKVFLLPAFPIDAETSSLSFRLAVKGNAVIEVTVRDGALHQVRITSDENDVTDRYEIYFRGEKVR